MAAEFGTASLIYGTASCPKTNLGSQTIDAGQGLACHREKQLLSMDKLKTSNIS